jgi:ketosteroid isomerase-like protein
VKQSNIQVIERFFEACASHDRERLATVMDENAQWTNLGKHPMAGVHRGIDEIVSFFDRMGKVMGESKVKVERLVTGAEGDYVVEAQHIRTARSDGCNLDHRACVLWRFSDGKIVEGTHFFSDHDAVDRFFTAAAK